MGLIIGIDVGLTGAVAVLNGDGSPEDVFDLPTMQSGDGGKRITNTINASGLRAKFRFAPEDVRRVVMEMPQGMGAMISPLVLLSLGHSAGIVEGVTSIFPFTRVAPHVWKKALGLSRDKEQSRARAQELFPTVDLSRKKDHNRAEALLIAYWFLRYGR